jgi:hypothetical protein
LAATSTGRKYDTYGGQPVSSYTITITPDDDRLASTTLRVEAGPTGGRIAELLVRAGSGGGLSARSLPPIDLDLVASALTSTTAQRSPAVTTRNADIAAAPADEPIATPNLALVRAAKSTSGRASRRTPGKRAGAGGRRRSSAATEAADGAQRAYRRMPDDLATVYAESGSVTVVARHYGVPRHTAQGWVGRLRSQGTVT